jgi:hypothetical protein
MAREVLDRAVELLFIPEYPANMQFWIMRILFASEHYSPQPAFRHGARISAAARFLRDR